MTDPLILRMHQQADPTFFFVGCVLLVIHLIFTMKTGDTRTEDEEN